MDESKVTPSTARLATLGAGVLVFHVMNSVLQEAVFLLDGYHHTVALTCLQTAGIALFALLEQQIRLRRDASRVHDSLPKMNSFKALEVPDSTVVNIVDSATLPCQATDLASSQTFTFGPFVIEKRAPLRTYLILSLLSTMSAILTNHASHLLNYPTQVVFKSSKLFFVMTLRMLFGMAKRKSISQIRKEFISCIFIVTGLVAFTYATSSGKSRKAVASQTETFSQLFEALTGVIAIIVALCCDAFLYLGEEKYCFDQYKASSGEVIFFTYGVSALNSFVMLVGTGALGDALAFSRSQPSFPLLILGFSMCNFFGTHFLLRVVSEFDSNAAVIVTSTRKILTILLSFLLYPKPFSLLHLLGLGAVALGIFAHEHTRVAHKKSKPTQ